MGSLSPSLSRASLFSNLSKTLSLCQYAAATPVLLLPRHHRRLLHFAPCVCAQQVAPKKNSRGPPQQQRRVRRHNPMTRHLPSTPTAPFSTALCPSPPVELNGGTVAADGRRTNFKSKNKARRESPEGILRHRLDMCSKGGDLVEALRLYDEARAQNVPMSQHHFNVILYLCVSSSPPTSADDHQESEGEKLMEPFPPKLGLERGFEIFRQMAADGIEPNEATFTTVARLAAAKDDPDMAFELIKKMEASGISPKLRSYGPALLGFCKKGSPDKAYELEAHMEKCGVIPEDAELSALLRMSSETGKGEQVYRLLHKLRALVRQVSESSAEVAQGWFASDVAKNFGLEQWDAEKVKEGVVKGGGGWHGQGWLGKGKWNVGRTEMDEFGNCQKCGERLVCIDIDPLETEYFRQSLSNLATQREAKADFIHFQEWLSRHGPFDAVIDGANVGLYKQSNFSFHQINCVVNGVREMSPSKRMPLVILHNKRVKGGPADTPSNKKLIDSWRKAGALYATPFGSNDDWYWLYAAVSCKCLLVTNDEMRDHLFQLLGNSFFPRWKEKHQVRLTFSRQGPAFHMPPPYSIVIQESETGNWHIPTVTGDDVESARQWVCATRAATSHSAASTSSAVHSKRKICTTKEGSTERKRLSSSF